MLRLFRRLLIAPLVALAYVSFALGGGLLGTFVMPWLYIWPGTRQQKQRRCQAVTSSAFKVFHWYLDLIGIMRFKPPARPVRRSIERAIEESRARGGPAAVMVVANHPTLVDTTAIMASFPYLIVVAKTSVFHFPLLRLLLQFCGHTVASARLGEEAALANHLIERMQQGDSLLLFPEATRSPDEGPRPFRRGPFEVALRAGAPIQPIVIDSGPGLLKGGLAWYEFPLKKTHYDLTPLPAIFPTPGPHPPPVAQKILENATVRSEPTSQMHSGRQLAQLVFSQISEALRLQQTDGSTRPGTTSL